MDAFSHSTDSDFAPTTPTEWPSAIDTLREFEHAEGLDGAIKAITRLIFEGRLQLYAADSWVSNDKIRWSKPAKGFHRLGPRIIEEKELRLARSLGTRSRQWKWTTGDFHLRTKKAPEIELLILKGVRFNSLHVDDCLSRRVGSKKRSETGRNAHGDAWAAIAVETIRLYLGGKLTPGDYPQRAKLRDHFLKNQGSVAKRLKESSVHAYVTAIYRDLIDPLKSKK